MYSSFDQYINDNSSEKIILAHIHAVKRIYNFTTDGAIVSVVSPYFVTAIKNGTNHTDYTKVLSIALVNSPNKFYYDITTSKIYLYSFDSLLDEIIVTYRFFYSNAPINLSWDLGDYSLQVEYSPIIATAPSFKTQMAQGKTSLNLSGTGNLVLINQGSELKNIYERMIWENKTCQVYSYHRDLAPSAALKIFDGIVSGKSFSSNSVTFKLNDSLFLLSNPISLPTYDTLVREADSKKIIRQIYGKVDNVLCQSISQVDKGYVGSGTISADKYNTTIVGVGTKFLTELSPNDTIIVNNVDITINSIINDTSLLVSEIKQEFYNLSFNINPNVHYYKNNRTFQISNHALKKFTTTILTITSRNRIIVADTAGFVAGDIITIDSESKTIRRLSGNTIVLTTNYNLPHSIGSTVSKTEINSVRYGDKETIISTDDFTINNTTNGCYFTINKDTEYNNAIKRVDENIYRFTFGKNKVWLGSPTWINLSFVGQTATGTNPTQSPTQYSLFGTYFTILKADGTTAVFWIKDTVDSYLSIFTIPSAAKTIADISGNSDYIIELESRPYTATEIATIIGLAISDKCSDWTYTVSAGTCTLESKDCIDISIGNAYTTGATFTKTLSGYPFPAHINLKDFLKSRDFIKTIDSTDSQWYEILEVEERSFTLRDSYHATSSILTGINYKNIDYINDTTPIYCNVFGKTKDGTSSGDYIETGSEIVVDILTQIGLASRIDMTTFNIAKYRAPFEMSLMLPLTPTLNILPIANDIINLVNKSCLGTLFVNNAINLGYDILDSSISDSLTTIYDNDLMSWSVNDDAFTLSETNKCNYRNIDYDVNSKSDSFRSVSFTSNFITNYVGTKNISESNIYVYSDSNALETAERMQFINSLSSSNIKLEGKLNLSNLVIGQRVILSLAGLYTSFGSNSSSLRIGTVSSINNTGLAVTMELIDLGSLYSRSGRISSDVSSNFSTALDSEKVINSYIVDDNGIIDTFEETAGTNLIS